MRELTQTQEAALAECLRALDAGATVESCLSRYPQHADALRPYLELRARLISQEKPEPAAPAYAAGRRALLERLAAPAPVEQRRSLWAALGWPRSNGWVRSPLARAAVVGAVLFALAGGALGASAAAGVDQAHDVLSTLHIISSSSQGDQHKSPNAGEGAANRDDGIANAPTAAAVGQQQADDHAANGSGNANGAPGAEHRPCLPADLLQRVPILQQLFSACETDQADTPPGDAVEHTPGGPPDEHGGPTNNGSDDGPLTPPRPTDAGRPTFVEPHPTADEQEAEP